LLPPLRFSARPEWPVEPAATLGQHTAELLAGLGYDEGQVERLRAEGVV
jgi:crotonobetainyl-CoA:carnitine CoA-transferase CaiB-like acyl-CoA transferase